MARRDCSGALKTGSSLLRQQRSSSFTGERCETAFTGATDALTSLRITLERRTHLLVTTDGSRRDLTR